MFSSEKPHRFVWYICFIFPKCAIFVAIWVVLHPKTFPNPLLPSFRLRSRGEVRHRWSTGDRYHWLPTFFRENLGEDSIKDVEPGLPAVWSTKLYISYFLVEKKGKIRGFWMKNWKTWLLLYSWLIMAKDGASSCNERIWLPGKWMPASSVHSCSLNCNELNRFTQCTLLDVADDLVGTETSLRLWGVQVVLSSQ